MVVIASDIQGPDAAIPWIEKARGEFRALIDRDNVVGKTYRLKYVPVGIFTDEDGRLVRPVGSVNIDDDVLRAELIEWVTTGIIPHVWMARAAENAETDVSGVEEREAEARYYLSRILLESGKRSAAIEELRRAFELDRENWIIRKQLWALENPEVFYKGKVDYAWQKARIAREDV